MKPPVQITTIEPFSPREWQIVNRDFSLSFPEPDSRDGTYGDFEEALYRAVRGEYWPLPGTGRPTKNRILTDVDFLDTLLLVTQKDTQTVTVGSGDFICCGVYVQFLEEFDIYMNSDSTCYYSFDGTDTHIHDPNGVYYVAIQKNESEDSLGVSYIYAPDYDVQDQYIVKDYFLILACVTLNGAGQIDTITYTNNDWDRIDYLYPLGPANPYVNGGVVRDGGWYPNWT